MDEKWKGKTKDSMTKTREKNKGWMKKETEN